MLASIDLDTYARFDAREVDEVFSDGVLAPKFVTVELA